MDKKNKHDFALKPGQTKLLPCSEGLTLAMGDGDKGFGLVFVSMENVIDFAQGIILAGIERWPTDPFTNVLIESSGKDIRSFDSVRQQDKAGLN
jgi:hypothetical protein